ncbi:acrosin-like [Erythrolamprus reginae]|uniref:acrosin-like n=1 Tax=Erythrolamprus reginae TaxID=121349 RepID=UPI00396CF406
MSQERLAPGGALAATDDPCDGVCGRRPLAASHTLLRVVGGTDALPGTWPWQVCFQVPVPLGYTNACGGTLLSARWVLTASHCFTLEDDIRLYRVALGLNRISQPGPDTQNRLIKRVINHEHYRHELNLTDGGIHNDISLVELNEPVRCNDYIQPACLPDKSVTISKLVQCSISGWGTMDVESQRVPDVMQEGVVKLIPHNTCSSLYWWSKRILPDNICAGHESGEISICQGDSGGPLMCREERSERYLVIGISSWAPLQCTVPRKPGVFTSTQFHLDWITATTKENLFKATHKPVLAEVWPPAKPTSPIQSSTQYVKWKRPQVHPPPRPPTYPSLTPGPMVPPSSRYTLRPKPPPQWIPGYRPLPWVTTGYRPRPSSRFTIVRRPRPPPRFTPAARPPPMWKPTQWHMMTPIRWYLVSRPRPTKWGSMTPPWKRTQATYPLWTGPALWGMTQPLWTTPRKWWHRTRASGQFRVTWASRQLQLQPDPNLSPPGYYVPNNWNPSFAEPGGQSDMVLPPRGPERD